MYTGVVCGLCDGDDVHDRDTDAGLQKADQVNKREGCDHQWWEDQHSGYGRTDNQARICVNCSW